jgi:hypothetical protein
METVKRKDVVLDKNVSCNNPNKTLWNSRAQGKLRLLTRIAKEVGCEF